MPAQGALSVCMIVKNEEANLRACLPAISRFADQIVVVDTGSSDASVPVAMSHGADVRQIDWQDDFSQARNVSLSLAKGGWVLWLDADDRIPDTAIEKLRALKQAPPAFAIALPVRNEMPGVVGERWLQLRMFPNDPRIRFVGRVHEQAIDAVRECGYQVVAIEDVEIVHVGYADPTLKRAKALRNRTLLEQALEDDPENVAYRFSHVDTFFTTGDYEIGLRLLTDLWSRVRHPAQRPLLSQVAARLALGCFRLGRLREAVEWAERALAVDPQHVDALYLGAEASLGLSLHEEAEAYYRRLIDSDEVLSFRTAQDHRGLRGVALIGLARLLAARGHRDEPLRLYSQCQSDCPELVEALAELGDLYLADRQLSRAEEQYAASIARHPGADAAAYFGLVRVMCHQRRTDEAARVLSEAMELFGTDNEIVALADDLLRRAPRDGNGEPPVGEAGDAKIA